MAATFRSSSTITTGGSPAGSLSITLPAGVQVNDVLLAVISVDGGTAATVTPPAGWTLLRNTTQSTNLRMVLYWRQATGLEPASYTWNFDTARAGAGSIQAYLGGLIFAPPAHATISSGTATTTPNPATVNSTYETGLIVQLMTTRNVTAINTVTPGAGYTERDDVSTTAGTFIGLDVADQSKGLPMGGTTPNAPTTSQSVTYISQVAFIEDARPAFNMLAVDEYVLASVTSTVPNQTLTTTQSNYPNTVLLMMVTINKDIATVTSVAGAGLTWVLVARANTNAGSTEMWRAFAPLPFTAQPITVTYSASVVSANIMMVGFVGADLTGTNGSGAIGNVVTGTSSAAPPSVSVTTTRDNAWVWYAANESGAAGGITAGTGQTIVRSQSDSTNSAAGWMQRRNALTPSAGTVVTMNSTQPAASNCNIIALEILPAIRKNLGTLGVG